MSKLISVQPEIKVKPEMKPPIPEPLPVGAHIRLFRWCFLIAGVFYGARRHSELYELEKVLKVERMERREERERRIAYERLVASEKDLAALAALAYTDDD
ncbi:hypothetical protein FQR65_LT08798 [Abscondita terminalis]|nr:hypothetical protein FQR65_LT08798 [Abscondita terminalis]